MRQRVPIVGELFRLNPGYTSGVWLRELVDSWVTGQNGHIAPNGIVIVLGVDNPISSDPSVLVLSSTGDVGWTFTSRLNLLEDNE